MNAEEQKVLDLLKKAAQAWRFPPQLAPSAWAEKYRVLTSESSAKPGPWRNEDAPHLVLPMDCMGSYHPARKVVLKFSSQSGKTEVILNALGYIIDCDPGPTLILQPNWEPMGERFSKQRVGPMLNSSPSLSKKVPQPKSRTGQTMSEKYFPGGLLFLGSASSPSGLASMPIRFLLCDEIDRWEVTKEGDALSLARERLETFAGERREKELVVSSPTYDDLGISVEYDACQTQYQRELICDHCGLSQFPRLRHFSGRGLYLRYACEFCGGLHEPNVEDRLKRAGVWVKIKDEGEETVGFWMSRWSSPFSRWADVLAKWDHAGNDPAKKQVVVNTSFAEGWEGEGEKIEHHTLVARAEVWEKVPIQVRQITIGVDCQGDRLELEVIGWGEGEESWSLEYEVLPGSPQTNEVWEDLKEYLYQTWEREDGVLLRPFGICVDSGGFAKEVYEFVKSLRRRDVYPIKGIDGFARDMLSGDDRQRRKREARRTQSGRPAEMLGVDVIKLAVYRALSVTIPGPKYCHFPAGRVEEYYLQLTGERIQVVQKRGQRPRRHWVPIHTAVEALDCRGYGYAAYLLTMGRTPRVEPRPPAAVTSPATPSPRRPPVPKPSGFSKPGWGL